MNARAKLGTMLKIDHNTSILSKGKFAGICVEIDLRRKLVLTIIVLGGEFKVEYLQMQSLRPLDGNLYEAVGYSNNGNGRCDD